MVDEFCNPSTKAPLESGPNDKAQAPPGPANERAHFARGLMQGILSMLKPGDVVFDCGANLGDVNRAEEGGLAELPAAKPCMPFEPPTPIRLSDSSLRAG